MDKIKLYIKEAYNELMNKVTWPTWEQLQSSSIVVMVASLLIAFSILAMDKVSKAVMVDGLYKLLMG